MKQQLKLGNHIPYFIGVSMAKQDRFVLSFIHQHTYSIHG